MPGIPECLPNAPVVQASDNDFSFSSKFLSRFTSTCHLQAAKEAAEAESATWQAKSKQLRATAKSKLSEQKKEIEQLQVKHGDD